jgi:Gylcosyl hydrolase family 115 C-terminal domain
VAVAKNRLYAAQGRASTDDMADKAEAFFKADQDLSDYFNHTLAGGKWNHTMDQTHIGYTTWQQPPKNAMPKVIRIDVPTDAALGVAIEGATAAWSGQPSKPALPDIDAFNQQSRYIDVFDREQTPFEFTATASDPWIVLSLSSGNVDHDQRIAVSVDWRKAPRGNTAGSVTIDGPRGQSVTIALTIVNADAVTRDNLDGFMETDHCVSIEAEHYTAKVDTGSAQWFKIRHYGRTLSGMSILSSIDPPASGPCLEYKMYLTDSGKADVTALIAPTQAFQPGHGLRFAISFDDQPPQVVDSLEHNSRRDWEESVTNSIRAVNVPVAIDHPGYHILKFWMVDPGIVLEKLIVDFGGARPSFLGPPESYRHTTN